MLIHRFVYDFPMLYNVLGAIGHVNMENPSDWGVELDETDSNS